MGDANKIGAVLHLRGRGPDCIGDIRLLSSA